MKLDFDLCSIQEARDLVNDARKAQVQFAGFNQEQVDRVVEAMAAAGRGKAAELARLAVEDTGFGVLEHKVLKNITATEKVWEYVRGMRTVGILNEDHARRVVEIAAPLGVVLSLVPSTNPTSTAMYNAIIALKSRNAIVVSPHPSAVRCTNHAAAVMSEAAVAAGAPPGIVGCLSRVSMAGTKELMLHENVAMILATGGAEMVKAAYSSGKPALGVGPGNVPVFIERSADIAGAVRKVVLSKTFDNGIICASEQAIVTENCIREKVVAALRAERCYFLHAEEVTAVGNILITPRGTVNPSLVGRPAAFIAGKAGFAVPEATTLLIAELAGVGPQYPLSREKLSPVLAFYTTENWEAACSLCIEILEFGGIGHSLALHSQDEKVIEEFAFKKPVFRILVNTPSAQGAVGISTGLAPAFTLGCGTWGGSATSDNITPLHLLQRKRLAYDLGTYDRDGSGESSAGQEPDSALRERIAAIVRETLAGLGR